MFGETYCDGREGKQRGRIIKDRLLMAFLVASSFKIRQKLKESMI